MGGVQVKGWVGGGDWLSGFPLIPSFVGIAILPPNPRLVLSCGGSHVGGADGFLNRRRCWQQAHGGESRPECVANGSVLT